MILLYQVEAIVTHSCGIAPKYSKMMVNVMKELQTRRQQSTLFLGKQGSVTPRDLIKWGNRQPQSPLEVAEEGYMLLGEKLRSEEEKMVVMEVLASVCKVVLQPDHLYAIIPTPTTSHHPHDDQNTLGGDKTAGGGGWNHPHPHPPCTGEISELLVLQDNLRSGQVGVEGVRGVALTGSIARMWKLSGRAIAHNEPVLLVGETGSGKTMVCQLLAAYRGQAIRILNCHQVVTKNDDIYPHTTFPSTTYTSSTHPSLTL